MVNEPRRVPHDSRVDDVVGVLAEHVAADAARLVVPFSQVRQSRPDYFPGILDDHLSRVEVATAEQAAAVDRRRIDTDRFTRERPQMSETHRHWQICTCRPPVGITNHQLLVIYLLCLSSTTFKKSHTNYTT